LVTNLEGGIIDDTIITNAGDFTYMIVNGATKTGDMEHFNERMKNFEGDVCFEYFHEQQLLALQGPSAATVLQALLPSDLDLKKVNFMTGFDTTVGGLKARVTRCGYTGEDGFEVSVGWKDATALADLFLKSPEVRLSGLGARDSLRLESGLCLYGNDIDATTTPVEAALGWTMGGPKGRRRKEQGFLGAEKFLTPEGKFLPIARKRVGLAGFKAPARAHTEIFDVSGGSKIGEVTSGTFSPSLGKPIAMGYVATEHAKEGTKVAVKVRGKLQEAEITKMPFVTQHYYKAT
jgi:aminomethyltransferase